MFVGGFEWFEYGLGVVDPARCICTVIIYLDLYILTYRPTPSRAS